MVLNLSNTFRRLMNYVGFAAIVTASGFVAFRAEAQTVDPPQRAAQIEGIFSCRALAESTARLACFDSAVMAASEAERQGDLVTIDRSQAETVRRELFGIDLPTLPAIFDRGDPANRLNTIETSLVRANSAGDREWVFQLTDGSTWRQVGGGTVRLSPRPNQSVKIRRGAVGSYLMTIENSQAIRVRRVTP